MPKRVKVIEEGPSGLNKKFRDNFTGKEMTRGEFADEIQKGNYPNHHIMIKDNRRIPRTNPDGTKDNNLN